MEFSTDYTNLVKVLLNHSDIELMEIDSIVINLSFDPEDNEDDSNADETDKDTLDETFNSFYDNNNDDN